MFDDAFDEEVECEEQEGFDEFEELFDLERNTYE